MEERLLCDEGLQVTLAWADGHTLITVKNGQPIAFMSEVAVLEDALNGVPLQLSSTNGYCHVEAKDDEVLLTFGLQGSGRRTCHLDRGEFAEAVAWLHRSSEAA